MMHGMIVGTLLALGGGVEQNEPLSGERLIEALRQGGYVIYFRHPTTDHDQADTDTFNLDNLKKQRHLTDKGRQEARSVGAAFRKLKISVGSVSTSKFYRAVEAAKLFDVGEVTPMLELTEPVNVSPNEAKRRGAFLKKQLGIVPAEGKNAVLVGHRGCLQDAIGKDAVDVSEGEAVIFKPDGKGSFAQVARVKIAQWSEWAN